jgi:NADH:ubiquinone oxidoreductase subunit E
MINITLCMGSSCYSRGNESTLRFLEEYIEKNELKGRLSLNGEHCMGNCAKGPVIKINDEEYCHLDANDIITLVNRMMEEENVL